MPTTESILFNIMIIAMLGLFVAIGYFFLMAEAQWRYNSWISMLHACHCWKHDYLDHYQELETDEELLKNPEDIQLIDEEDKGFSLDEIYLAEWHATSASEDYFIGLEHLDKARERLYSPAIFSMMVWQVLLPWGSVRLTH
ncbi:hypothetical protein GWN26_04660 [Candidatus Saccharibacteria bacterium]|nr:hypothetical protein [Candidatus Saccharibacteria bacterium]NIV03524.1 hypothetical protein [Calditrichia bacterium]NIS38069.1 hypothetical protein [Candidatus Saccharibacteria bacterium]NIV71766.1 hypothetical protein [Calditrichia bacterium]NIV98464.1 hypothetical protein [Candidatus Saccharibacteria bacterium]